MVTYIKSPSQIKVILNFDSNLGTSYIFDKENVNLVEVKEVENFYGTWETSAYQTKYKYFDCKKTPMFFFK